MQSPRQLEALRFGRVLRDLRTMERTLHRLLEEEIITFTRPEGMETFFQKATVKAHEKHEERLGDIPLEL